jgi:hypothetical protein
MRREDYALKEHCQMDIIDAVSLAVALSMK